MLIKLNLQRFATSQVSIDLTTLSGWGNVADGQHSIQVVAKANGYRDSQPSAAVSVTKGAEQDELAGTWLLNNTITFNSSIGLPNINSFNFTSNNASFYGFYFDVDSDGDNSLGYRTNQAYSFIQIYNSGGNIISGKEAYKTITITSKLTEVTNGDQLLAWLQANGVKQ